MKTNLIRLLSLSLLPAALAAGCVSTKEIERPSAITAPSGDDCVHVVDRFEASLVDAGIKVERERVKGGIVLSGKYTLTEEEQAAKAEAPADVSLDSLTPGDLNEKDAAIEAAEQKRKQDERAKAAKEAEKAPKKSEETYYLVVKTPSDSTKDWNGVLKGVVSSCLYKKQSLDVILKMAE